MKEFKRLLSINLAVVLLLGTVLPVPALALEDGEENPFIGQLAEQMEEQGTEEQAPALTPLEAPEEDEPVILDGQLTPLLQEDKAPLLGTPTDMEEYFYVTDNSTMGIGIFYLAVYTTDGAKMTISIPREEGDTAPAAGTWIKTSGTDGSDRYIVSDADAGTEAVLQPGYFGIEGGRYGLFVSLASPAVDADDDYSVLLFSYDEQGKRDGVAVYDGDNSLPALIADEDVADEFAITYVYDGEKYVFAVTGAKTTEESVAYPVTQTWQSGSIVARLFSSGELVISGSGAMPNYTSSSEMPWYDVRASITSLRLAEGITAVGDYAFYGCSAIAEVNLPCSLTSIGWYSFRDCTALAEITLPDSLTSLAYGAFYGCTSLTAVYMGGKVASGDSNTFYRCSALQNVYVDEYKALCVRDYSSLFPSTAVIHYKQAEAGSVLKAWNIGTGDETDVQAKLYADGTLSILGEGSFYKGSWLNGELTRVVIGDGITAIPSGAFRDASKLASVTLADSVTSIGRDAFQNCTALAAIDLPEAVGVLGESAFSGCTALTAINLPAGALGKKISSWQISAASSVFANCTALQSVTIGEGTAAIGSSAFSGCTALREVIIPDSVTSIGNYAFLSCTALNTVTVGKGVSSIAYDAFSGCKALTTVNFNAVNCGDAYKTSCIFSAAGQSGSGITLNIGDSVGRIPAYLFYTSDADDTAMPKLKAISIADDAVLAEVGSYAFYRCGELTSAELGSALRTVGDGAFNSCEGLTEIRLAETVEAVGRKAFFRTGLLRVNIDSEAAAFGESVFADCPEALKLYGYSGSTAQTYAAANSLTFVPYTVSGTIGDLSWNYSDGTLSFSGSGAIPDMTSDSCPWKLCIGRIKEIDFSSAQITSIGAGAFASCTKLTAVTLPNSLTQLSNRAFAYCSNLALVRFAGEMPTLADESGSPTQRPFATHTAMRVQYLRGNTTWGSAAWTSCTIGIYSSTVYTLSLHGNHENVTYNKTLNDTEGTVISLSEYSRKVLEAYYLYASWDNLIGWNTEASGSGTSYASNADLVLTGNKTLYAQWESVPIYEVWYMSNTEPEWGTCYTYMPGDWVSLESISNTTEADYYSYYASDANLISWNTQPDGSGTEYSRNAKFRMTESIGNLTLYAQWKYSSAHASGACGNLNWSIGYNGELTITGSGEMPDYSSASSTPWYQYRDSITGITVGSGVTRIGDYAFYHCSGASYILLPEGLTSIGERAISQCYELRTVTLPSTVRTIGDYAFYNSFLASITLSSSLQTIGECAFGSTSIQKITLPEGLTGIGERAFEYCWDITSIAIPASVQTIGAGAFYNCGNLESISVDSGSAYFCAADGVLFNKNMTELLIYPAGRQGAYRIPDGVRSIEQDYAFLCARGLTSLTIPASLQSFTYSLQNCSALTAITVENRNTGFKSVDGVLYSADGKTLYAYPAGKTASSYAIPAGVTTIKKNAFYGADIGTVTVPASVTKVEDMAFFGSEKVIGAVYFKGNAPVLDGDVFGGYYELGTTMVSHAANTTGWEDALRGKLANASYQNSIQYAEAAFCLQSNGLLYEICENTYNYDPTQNPTRAQVCYAIAQANRIYDYSGSVSFYDVSQSNRYYSAIAYCVNKGYMAGTSASAFSPYNTVTGYQLAKLLLLVLGYDAARESLNGAGWMSNTASLASSVGLFDGLKNFDGSAPITYDIMCQMIYNALFADAVTYKRDGTRLVEGVWMERLPAVQYASYMWCGDHSVSSQASLARSSFYVDGSRYNGAAERETALGDLITDGLLWYAQEVLGEEVDAALVNGGSIREELYNGAIRFGNLTNILAFDNTVSVVEVTGEQLLEALEAACQALPDSTAAFPQIAGMTVEVLPNVRYQRGSKYSGTSYYAPADIGGRVRISYVGDRPFSRSAAYRIVTNDYLANGGDGYVALTDASDRWDGAMTVASALAAYLKTGLNGQIPSRYRYAQGRISLLSGREFSGPKNVTGSHVSGAVYAGTRVKLSCANSTEIYYTLDGSEPTVQSARYTRPFVIEQNTTIRAIAVLDGQSSEVSTFTYTIAASAAPALGIATVRSGKGGTVNVTVSLANNPGLNTLRFGVSYDTEALQLVSVTDGGILGSAENQHHSNNLNASPYHLFWNNARSADNFTANGTLATLTFKVKTSARLGDYPITITGLEALNSSENNVALTVINGSIFVEPILLGDVNGDGEVNAIDSMILLRYLSDWPGYAEKVDMLAADISGDGDVGLPDCIALLRHLAKWKGYETLGNKYSGEPVDVVLATGGTSGTYYAMGGVLQTVLGNKLELSNLTVESTGASKANIKMMTDGEAQMAIVQSDVLNYAHEGTFTFSETSAETSALWVMGIYNETIQILAKPGINSVADLRGKTVCVGDVGSGTEINAWQVMSACGLTKDDVNAVNGGFQDGVDQLKDGKIDAAFTVAGAPTTAIVDYAATNTLNLVSLTATELAAVTAEYQFLVRDDLAVGTYQGQTADVTCVAVQATLVADETVPEDVVYEFVKAIYDNQADLTAGHAKWGLLSVETALNNTAPLHPGAERFYREIGAL